MASDTFKCRLCGETVSGGFLSRNPRYSCPKHKFICDDHVSSGWLGGNPKCKACGKPVMRYKYHDEHKRWEKA